MKIAALSLLLVALLARAEWTQPRKLMTTNKVQITSVYHDPTAFLNYLLLLDTEEGSLRFLVLSNDGAELYSILFNDANYTASALVRGAGNGKNIFMALPYSTSGESGILFSESTDGGFTWSNPAAVLPRGKDRRLQDVVYLAATGRVYVFFLCGDQLRVVSRPPGSTVFSTKTLVANEVAPRISAARAAHDGTALHVAYVSLTSQDTVMYTRSENGGATWLPAQKLVKETVPVIAVTHMIASSASPLLLVAYTSRSAPAKLVYSRDHGRTFGLPVKITNVPASKVDSISGFAVCPGDMKRPLLDSMFPTNDGGVEYAIWSADTMLPERRPHPFEGMNVVNTAALGCQVDAGKAKLTVGTFVTVWAEETGYLFNSAERTTVSSSE